MIRPLLVVSIAWALGSYLLWGIMSRAKGGIIDIDWRDRGVALFWLPMIAGYLLWGVLSWAFRKGRCI